MSSTLSPSGLSGDIDMPRETGAHAAERLVLIGVRENNLKELTLSLPHDKIIAVTGLSGSGKSTLAIDTIYAEGGRRYIETFSPYTRQFLDRLKQPDLDAMHGVRPALALEQRNRVTSSRSTVGTSTEINDYLKTVWAQLAEPYCCDCGATVGRDTPRRVVNDILQELRTSPQVVLAFPVAISGRASIGSMVETLRGEGFVRCIDTASGKVLPLESLTSDQVREDQPLLVVVDRVRDVPDSSARERLLGSVNQCYTYGKGSLVAFFFDDAGTLVSQRAYHETLRCGGCGAEFREPRSYMFSFNSPLGACPGCHGFGRTLALDLDLCVPNPQLSIAEGAVQPWTTDSTRYEAKKLRAACEKAGIDVHTPWHELPETARRFVINGSKDRANKYRGLAGWFDHLQTKRHKMHVRVFLARYRTERECPDCNGTRIRSEGLCYRLHAYTLPEIWRMPLGEALPLFKSLAAAHRGDERVEIPLEEIASRLEYLVNIGLGYLTLDRQTRTLSGGESQRVNLTAILGARLVNTILVLDEPTIGLHPTDTSRLIETMQLLRDRGNTVIVVEHDGDVIRAADEVIDIGPGSGAAGGGVVFQGAPSDLHSAKESFTGQYLAGATWFASERSETTEDRATVPKRRGRAATPAQTAGELVIRGARAHNLREIDVTIPLGKLVLLTGVSGSGKSSLVNLCVEEPFRRLRQGMLPSMLFGGRERKLSGLDGIAALKDLILIDQSPLGKTPRANPATYTKAWDVIRDCLAETPAAQTLGLTRSAFSFNVEGGRCLECGGAGYQRIEMQFLADVFVQCEACSGTRFQDKVLGVTYAGKNVVELLNLTLDDAVALFRSVAEGGPAERVVSLLTPLIDLGLGYLRLGHPLSLLSGGEAQRLKLASYLGEGKTGGCLFVLDEPTTGLHPYNVAQLVNALRALIRHGHSVLCIEHNLDVIGHADWMIDLGPGAGSNGGTIVAEGSPSALLADHRALAASSTLRALAEHQGRALPGKVERSAAPVGAVVRLPVPHDARARQIEVYGARHHNLKDVSVTIPQNTLTVVTGVSGSGKSTLAFDILFAEGQRRYIDCLSPYARQYIKQLSRADVDRVASLPPTIAISQKTSPPLGVSTIATVTELYQFLRLLFSKVGAQHCPFDDTPIASYSSASLVDEIMRRFAKQRVHIFAPVVQGRKGFYNDLFHRALRAEITEARVDGRILSLSPDLRLERHKLHWISLLVGSIAATDANTEMLRSAVEHALLLGGGTVEVAGGRKDDEPVLFSSARTCPSCQRGFRPLDPQDFSFRSSRGVCGKCSGRGYLLTKDDERGRVCPECSGARIGAIGRHVYVADEPIFALTQRNASQLREWLGRLALPSRLAPVVEPILRELVGRLEVIEKVGLDYLVLDRDASTISGGEAQRLRLAKALGSPLSGVCYVLDEPSIGLHPHDHAQLMATLFSLRDTGNTVVVVEHDEETIRSADHIIDIGPLGGAGGGELVATGTVEEIEASERSVTGAALRERRSRVIELRAGNLPHEHEWIEVRGARANNLKNQSFRIPLRRLTVVAGVSGAGKSSLVHGSLVPAIIDEFDRSNRKRKTAPRPDRTWDSISGIDAVNRLIEIDQTPVGKTITSTPASFLGILDSIRKLYSQLPAAKTLGWDASHFSFNTGKGRCPDCSGRGLVSVPMSFLPDATTVCESCGGMRYTEDTLEVRFQGLSIGDLLRRTMNEARDLFAHHPSIRRALDYVHELGIGYLTLGQPTYTLSGGETQRLKIARELGLREAVDTVYILDEPTIGLHMADVEKLLRVLRRLIDRGNTIVLIEHDLDVMRAADYLIEVGPGPGTAGGRILFQGAPAELCSPSAPATPTRRFLAPATPEAPVNKRQRKRA